MPNKTTKDSLGRDAAWAKWEKGYMDRTHKMKGTKFEKPITPEENRREMEMERGEFMYDKAKGQIRLRKTDDAERPLEMRSPLQMVGVKSPLNKISGPCKTAAKKKFKVWPSAYASGWGVRCTKAGGPSKYGGGSKK